MSFSFGASYLNYHVIFLENYVVSHTKLVMFCLLLTLSVSAIGYSSPPVCVCICLSVHCHAAAYLICTSQGGVVDFYGVYRGVSRI